MRELLQQALRVLYDSVSDREGWCKQRERVVAALEAELAKPESIVSFNDSAEGLCVEFKCNGSYFWQNLSEIEAAAFFVNAYRDNK